jgi:hypothetical protein
VTVAAIDPGKDGAWAVRFPNGDVLAEARENCSPAELVEHLQSCDVKRVLMEELEVFSGSGSAQSNKTSAINWGRLYERILAAGIGIETVRASKWKSRIGVSVPKGSTKQKKEAAITKAKELFPGVSLKRSDACKVDHDGLAEALLILEFGKREGIL